jgi:pimeloyl-ACP methyl ester carboxylesterase
MWSHLGASWKEQRWMVELRRIETGPGLVFDVSIAGDAAAPLVLLLHGFAVSRHLYDAQLPALAEAGYFAVAPDQRGYSPGARPDPADPARHYDIELLIGDALGLAAAVGHGARRVPPGRARLGRQPRLGDRRPPPGAAGLAHHAVAAAPRRLRPRAARGPGAAAPIAAPQGLPRPGRGRRPARRGRQVAAHAPRRARRAAGRDREAPLGARQPAGDGGGARLVPRPRHRAPADRAVRVPTLFIWGDADDTVGRVAAEGTADFVQAPYRFEALPGVGHYAPTRCRSG